MVYLSFAALDLLQVLGRVGKRQRMPTALQDLPPAWRSKVAHQLQISDARLSKVSKAMQRKEVMAQVNFKRLVSDCNHVLCLHGKQSVSLRAGDSTLIARHALKLLDGRRFQLLPGAIVAIGFGQFFGVKEAIHCRPCAIG